MESMASEKNDQSPEPVVTPRPQSDPACRPFPLVRAVRTIATGAVLVTLIYSSNYIHENIPNPQHAPFQTVALYSAVVMSVVGLLNGAILFWTWRRIRGAVARGLLLAATGALTGAVGGACIGSMEWKDVGNASISRALGTFGVGFINMVVWAVGGAVGGEPRRSRTRAVNDGEGRSWRPRLSLHKSLVGLAILLMVAGAVAVFDRAFLNAYTTKPLRGLQGWGVRTKADAQFNALAEIAYQHVSALSTILIGLWVVRRRSDGRVRSLVPVAVVFLLLFALLSISSTMMMLSKILEA